MKQKYLVGEIIQNMSCKWSETYQALTKETTQERDLLPSSIYEVPERPKGISSQRLNLGAWGQSSTNWFVFLVRARNLLHIQKFYNIHSINKMKMLISWLIFGHSPTTHSNSVKYGCWHNAFVNQLPFWRLPVKFVWIHGVRKHTLRGTLVIDKWANTHMQINHCSAFSKAWHHLVIFRKVTNSAIWQCLQHFSHFTIYMHFMNPMEGI